MSGEQFDLFCCYVQLSSLSWFRYLFGAASGKQFIQPNGFGWIGFVLWNLFLCETWSAFCCLTWLLSNMDVFSPWSAEGTPGCAKICWDWSCLWFCHARAVLWAALDNFLQTIHVAFQLQIETNPHFDPILNAIDDNPQPANQNVPFVNFLWCQGPLLDTFLCTYIRNKHAVAIQPVSELSNGWLYWRGQLTFSPTPLKETSDHYCQPQLSTLNGYWAVWWGLWACMCVKVVLERNAYNISKRESPRVY